MDQLIQLLHDPSLAWYITRASGLVSLGLLIIIVILGILNATGVMFRWLEPVAAWRLHRALALSLLMTVLIHLVSLLFDLYFPFTLTTLLIPFKSTLLPVTIFGYHLGSLLVALGIFAFYIVLVVVLSSLYWIDRKPRWWKLIHFLSYVLVTLVLLHGFFIGTESKITWVRIVYYILFGLIIIGIDHRLTRVGAVRNGLLARWLKDRDQRKDLRRPK